MPDWWKQIPVAVKIGTTLVFVFLAGVSIAPHLELPETVDRNRADIAILNTRVASMETSFAMLIRRLDRHFCVELAEEEGRSATQCEAAFGNIGRDP